MNRGWCRSGPFWPHVFYALFQSRRRANPVEVRLRLGVGVRNRPFAALTTGQAKIFPGRGPLSGADFVGRCYG